MGKLAGVLARKRGGGGRDDIIAFQHSSNHLNDLRSGDIMSAPPPSAFLDLESEDEAFPPRTSPMQIHGAGKDKAGRRKGGKARSRKGRSRGHGSSGKKLAMLSGKTDKIMASYQDYLTEIESENIAPRLSDSSVDEDTDSGGSLRDSYQGKFLMAVEEGSTGSTEGSTSSSSSSSAGRSGSGVDNRNYAVRGELQRAWSYGSDGAGCGAPTSLFDDGAYVRKLRKRRMRRGIALVAIAAVILGAVLCVVVVNHEAKHDAGLEIGSHGKGKPEIPVRTGSPHHVLHKNGDEDKGVAMAEENEEKDEVDEKAAVSTKEEELQVNEGGKNAPVLPPAHKEAVEEEEEEENHYAAAVKKYQPVSFDRARGYTGKTYRDALEFCAGKSLAVCPYAAICPDSYRGEALGGFREGAHGDWVWVPLIDEFNDWTQVGARERCTRYTQKYGGDGPKWGISGEDESGEDVEGLTRNVMCCRNVM